MIRFLFGMILGFGVCAIGLGAAAVLNPLPGGPVASMTVAGAPAAPAPAAPEPAAPEPAAPAVATSPEPVAPEPAPAPDTSATAAPAAPSIGGAPQPAGLTGSTAPEAASGPGLMAPSIGGDSGGGIAVRSDSSPVRTASAPQVSIAGTGAGAAPAVNTESAAVPDVGSLGTPDYAAIVAGANLPAGTALTSNAAVFNGDLSKPLMGIVLIDTGEAEALRSGLTALSAPITFAVSADIDGAAAVAKFYRDAGFEVASSLPQGALPGLSGDMALEEVPQRLAAAIAAVPGATTIIDSLDGPIARDRDIMQVALHSLLVTGHGLLTYSSGGANTVPQFADELGVYSDVISRVIDAAPGAENISAALDQAVQDARRTGAVIVVGHMNQDTVATLFQWILGAEPRDVTVAPVSVVLR